MSTPFEIQCKRIELLVKDGCVTPELGSLMLHYFTLGLNESSKENFDARTEAIERFNPLHDDTMIKYRASRPAKLILDDKPIGMNHANE